MAEQANTRWNSKIGIHGERAYDFDRAWYRYALELIEVNVEQGAKVLELCCGAGEFSQLLNRKGYQTVSVDGDSRNIVRLQQLGLEAHCANLEAALPFDDGRFDMVVILEGIEHIVNCESLLEEISRVTKCGGYLVISTPNFAWFQDRFKYLFGHNATNEGVHLRFFTVKSLSNLIKSRGYTVIAKNSFTPFIGFNRIMRLIFRKKPLFLKVKFIESFLAQDLVWLSRKGIPQ